jgi:hypothetical protein
MAALFAQHSRLEEDLLRHIILNSLRMYNQKFRKSYGEMVIACDSGSWRRDVFPEYKAARRTSKDENKSGTDWVEFYRIINLVKAELEENFPYKVVYADKAEADDVIAVLTQNTQVDFGMAEDVMIISADHDFVQLQRFGNVRQFSPLKKKAVTDKNPAKFLAEHIIRGDGGDGVPNILSADDCFVTGTRQTPVSAKKIDKWLSAPSLELALIDESQNAHRNFKRNQTVIDFNYIPDAIRDAVTEAHKHAHVADKSKIFNYLVSKRCNQLIGSCADFF